MIKEFDGKYFDQLMAAEVRNWYSEHHTEQDLADAYNLVHEAWKYHEDCTYDYEEGTPEYEESLKTFDEWDSLFRKLDRDIQKAMNKDNPDDSWLDMETLEKFMDRHGYENNGGWFFRKE